MVYSKPISNSGNNCVKTLRHILKTITIPNGDTMILENSLNDTIIAELRNLEDGWSGQNSIAPSAQIIMDVNAILKILKLKSKDNLDIQVDEDGKVTFFWMKSPEELLSMDIYGDGTVRCNFSPENFSNSVSDFFDVSDSRQIYNFIDSKIGLH